MLKMTLAYFLGRDARNESLDHSFLPGNRGSKGEKRAF